MPKTHLSTGAAVGKRGVKVCFRGNTKSFNVFLGSETFVDQFGLLFGEGFGLLPSEADRLLCAWRKRVN